MGDRARAMWWSVGLTVAGTTAFVLFMSVARARCPYERVPVREWTLLLGAPICGVLGLVVFHVDWIRARARRSGSGRGRRGPVWWLALVVAFPTYLLIPVESALVAELLDKHGIGEVSECFGQAVEPVASVEPLGTGAGTGGSPVGVGPLFSRCTD